MHFYKEQHNYYCGIDLHARSMYLCILDSKGNVKFHKDLKTSPEALKQAIKTYLDGLVIAVECMFSWYWIADFCEENNIVFILGHALYMKAIHGGKAKNDKVDSYKIANLIRCKSNRKLVEARFADPSAQRSVDLDIALINFYDEQLTSIEYYIKKHAKVNDYQSYMLLNSVRGVGQIISLVILYEIYDIKRFSRVQDFASYARLVKCKAESAGKSYGTSGAKIGNAHLKWTFSEAAVIFLRDNPKAKAYVNKMTKKHNKGKALSILAHKLGRAIYFILKRKQPFNMERFLPV